MTTTSYQVPAQAHHVELEIKRSKFLTFASPAVNRQEAEEFIRSLRDQHPQASHVCWAYIAGAPNTTIRSMSDDGEPSGTAGMPMLKVLEYSGYGDIVVAVVRYFGGTKLGTGGLQRAYSDAVSLVLTDLPLKLKVSRTRLQLTYDYSYDGSISRLLARYDVEGIQPNYAQQVSLTIAIANSELSTFKTEVTNITAGNVEVLLPKSE
ncbi:YigZ family protein [uncultured Paraglaciecola sp.]|uniref:YigZ family protein n=1 Tax=uncultured Paraglaciecola sp. TaxID=1765024 RepID=UPI0030DCAFAE|tara:strand:+ start:562879 stop:563499 length:621 start_codon:yes stop_codon:yes gene_type:complete